MPPSRAPLLGASPRHLLTYLLTSPRATLLDEFRVCPLVSLVSVRFVQGKCAAAVSVFTPSTSPSWPAVVVRWNCPPDRSLDCVGGPAECLRSMAFLSDTISDYNTYGNAALSRSLEQWLMNDWEADGQAEAAESPAPPQPTSPAVPTVASGVGEPEVSSPPRPSSPSFLRPSLPPSLPPSPSLSPPHPARGDRLLDRCVAGARSGRRCSRSAGGRP
jgi:hypothetical protein